MPPAQDDILTEVRLALARLEVKVQGLDQKMDSAVVSREHLENRLAPLTENMNKWKGGMAAITLVAGSVGALVTTVVKYLLTGGSSP
jgi:peptidoglycan hydrolase CwlO-like protein